DDGSLIVPSSATMMGGTKQTSAMMRKICAKMTGPGSTPCLFASTTLSTGPVGTAASVAVMTSTFAAILMKAPIAKPNTMVRSAAASIGNSSDPIAETAAGVKASPTD